MEVTWNIALQLAAAENTLMAVQQATVVDRRHWGQLLFSFKLEGPTINIHQLACFQQQDLRKKARAGVYHTI